MHTNTHESTDALINEVVGAAYEVQNVLGAGFLEKVYERALSRELMLRGLRASSQVRCPVVYKGEPVGEYIADLIVDDTLLVELKCADSLAGEHVAQCINCLTATGLRFALLINFQHPKVTWKRIVYG